MFWRLPSRQHGDKPNAGVDLGKKTGGGAKQRCRSSLRKTPFGWRVERRRGTKSRRKSRKTGDEEHFYPSVTLSDIITTRTGDHHVEDQHFYRGAIATSAGLLGRQNLRKMGEQGTGTVATVWTDWAFPVPDRTTTTTANGVCYVTGAPGNGINMFLCTTVGQQVGPQLVAILC